jgi:hypothetical protein
LSLVLARGSKVALDLAKSLEYATLASVLAENLQDLPLIERLWRVYLTFLIIIIQRFVQLKLSTVISCSNNLAAYALEAKQFERSQTLFEKCLTIAMELKNPVKEALAHYHLGALLSEMQNIPLAESHFRAGLEIARAQKMPTLVALVN